MQTDDHALVDLGAVTDEHATALLQVEQGVGQRLARGVGDHHAVLAAAVVALLERTVVVEHAVDEA